MEFKIGTYKISSAEPCFIIAELSANHGGSKEVALETIKAAKRAGADAIKLQTYTPDTITLNLKHGDFIIKQGTIWDGRSFYELYADAYTPWDWHKDLFDAAKKEGLVCFSSPFDRSAVDFLEELNAPAYKIASFEITDIPLIEYVASKGKPVIISTGIAAHEDIERALQACRKAGNNSISLLQCTSAYPAKIEDANLVMIKDLADKYKVISGLSDHTMGTTVPVVAVAMGAKIIEKHFILNKSIGGPDASFSLDEQEFSQMVTAVRDAEQSIGKVSYELSSKAKKSRELSRSLYIAADVKKGETITEKNVRSVRPGFGMHPMFFNEILGKKFKMDFSAGTALKKEMIEE